MKPIRTIAVIGATGRLGAPVATELARAFEVRAIVRSPEKARAMLPANVEIVPGDLRDVESLRAGLQGVDAIYINLATETGDLDLDFYEEREGVANLMEAIRGLAIQYIAKIGSLGAYPPAVARIRRNAAPNLIRMQGHQIIADSGIAHTFFAPTHFMELLPTLIDQHALQWIGNTGVSIYWISVADYARQVANAFRNPSVMPEHCAIQGPEALTVKKAMQQFVRDYDPTLKIRVAPLWVIRLIGLFNARMRFFGSLFAYFGDHEDPFYAAQTWQALGRPETTLQNFARNLRTTPASLR
nr:NAD(P)H-binding protein [uncultured Devosia sp.]